jgi:argininosuccinate synthase
MAEKVVLAYSGGLDTSVAVRWLKEEGGYKVIALTVDVGMQRAREEAQSRALEAGAASPASWRRWRGPRGRMPSGTAAPARGTIR